MSSKYEFIDGEKANYPIVKMCRWAEVSKSGFYEWRDRPASATTERRAELRVRIIRIFADADGASGYRRVHAQLERDGVEAGPELVRQIMAVKGWWPASPARFGSPHSLTGRRSARPICVDGTSPLRRRASSWLGTSLMCGRGTGGCIWPR